MGYMSLPSSELRYSTGQNRQLSSKVPIDKEYDSSQEGVLEYLCFDIPVLKHCSVCCMNHIFQMGGSTTNRMKWPKVIVVKMSCNAERSENVP